MYENYKFYGPYKAKDGRLRLFIKNKNGDKHTISYPKYIIELHLGRYLEKNEQVDHIDGNPLNNNIENLQILKLKNHQILDALRNNDVTVNCKYCNKLFTIKGKLLSGRNRPDKPNYGYFCSRQCSGKYGKEIQLGLKTHIIIDNIVTTKYKVKSAQNENFDVEVD